MPSQTSYSGCFILLKSFIDLIYKAEGLSAT